MSRKRNSRDRRRPGQVILTTRDEALLRALNRFRVARSSDLRRLLFAHRSPGRGAERLRQLFHAGFLDVRLGRLSEENVYSLGPAGRRWIESLTGRVGKVPVGGRAHHLEIVSVWAGLSAAICERSDATLRHFRPDWELRELQGRLALPVVPDALVEFQIGGELLRLALEVDLATERQVVWRRKLEAYGRLRWRVREEWGWSDLPVLILVCSGGEKRAASLRQLVEKEPWTGVKVVDRNAWPAAALTPPTTSAYSKRVEDALTPDASTAPTEGEAGLSPKRLAGSVGS